MLWRLFAELLTLSPGVPPLSQQVLQCTVIHHQRHESVHKVIGCIVAVDSSVEQRRTVHLRFGRVKVRRHPLKRLSGRNPAVLELKVVSPNVTRSKLKQPQKGNEKPRVFRLLKDEGIINHLGFNNLGIDIVTKKLQSRYE